MLCNRILTHGYKLLAVGAFLSFFSGCTAFTSRNDNKPSMVDGDTTPVEKHEAKKLSRKTVTPATVTFGHLRKITFETNRAYMAALDALHYRASRSGQAGAGVLVCVRRRSPGESTGQA